MSLNSKKICFSLVLAAAAGMVQAANGSCLLADAGFVAVQDNTASAGNYSSNRPKEKQRLSVPLPWRKRLPVYRNF